MNGKIEMGVGLVIVLWAIVAAFYGQLLLGALLAAGGVALFIYGERHRKGTK